MSDEKRDPAIRERVEADSDDLLAAVDDIRRLELEKRKVPMSSPDFHARAQEIEQRSRLVFGLARKQEDDGRRLSRQQAQSIDNVARQVDEEEDEDSDPEHDR